MNHAACPLIGILTSTSRGGFIAGNKRLFQNLQKKLLLHNGRSFVFTIEGARQDKIEGYTYSAGRDLWMKELFPYPDLVYNRIPSRKTENREEVQAFLSVLKEKKIPYFNPCFIDKYELYQLMNHDPILKTYLPETILVQEKKDLELFLAKHDGLYLKPANESKGRGIYRLRYTVPPELESAGINCSSTYPSLEHFWQEWQEKLVKKHYLAQEEIHSDEYDGCRYDFRILAHAWGNDYRLTGVGVRQSQEQTITTHIPSGGRLLPYKLLQTKATDQFIKAVIPQIGRALSKKFGYFGEFSIDAGVSKTGQYYLYEVNSKPMKFDEPEIEAERLNELCRLFLELTK